MKALSIFSGCGGLDIGVENAGFENVANIECDENAVKTLEYWKKVNHKDNTIYNADIRTIDPHLFANAGIDLLHG
jgi:DNA (cytosine-5)-methyltransferase 1